MVNIELGQWTAKGALRGSMLFRVLTPGASGVGGGMWAVRHPRHATSSPPQSRHADLKCAA